MFKVTIHDPKSLRWWFLRKKEIDFDPPYQRKSNIWSKYDRAYLIDSMLNDFDIPKIYLADFSYAPSKLNKGRYLYAIIDGKQRFEAIFSFFDNQLTLNKDFIFLKNPKIRLSGLTYRDLQNNYPEIAEEFDQFSLSIMSVITDEELKIEELFIRLNRSKPLTGSELRSAMPGPIPSLINKLSLHEFFENKIRFQKTRKAEYNLVAKIVITESVENFTNTMKKNLDDYVIKHKDESDEKFENHYVQISDVLDMMTAIFIDKDPLLKTSGPVLLYYWFTKEFGKRYRKLIRDFLIKFNECREILQRSPESQYKGIIKRYGFTGNPVELLNYSVSLRSINNQKNLSIAYKILKKWFKQYSKSLL